MNVPTVLVEGGLIYGLGSEIFTHRNSRCFGRTLWHKVVSCRHLHPFSSKLVWG